MRVLVLGGSGFAGRHAAAALYARGHEVIIGTRRPRQTAARDDMRRYGIREAHLEDLSSPGLWAPLLNGIQVVVNTVGILRQRGRETYDRVHHKAPAALARACRRRGIRLVHVSALGLSGDAGSGFIRSKLAGERAIAATEADYCIVRPALLDGEGGYGAAWLRWLARLPIHLFPGDARGHIDALDVRDLGEAIAVLCERRHVRREVELGGGMARTMAQYLATLRALHSTRPALQIPIPPLVARLASHLCDFLHFSPFSFGHLELMRRDNLPGVNMLPGLLGRSPRPVGAMPPMPSAPPLCPAPFPPLQKES